MYKIRTYFSEHTDIQVVCVPLGVESSTYVVLFVVIFVYLPLFMFCFEIHSRLTVTDSDGTSSSENAYITVEPEKDDPPTADTGGSVHKIRLPLDHITIRANKSQDDHGIKEYKWEQIDTSDEDKLININVRMYVCILIVERNQD